MFFFLLSRHSVKVQPDLYHALAYFGQGQSLCAEMLPALARFVRTAPVPKIILTPQLPLGHLLT